MKEFCIGQRWVSEMEPELGLGLITDVSGRTVRIRFPASETERQYAILSAPLKRVEYSPGDTIRDRSGAELRIEAVEESKGLRVYVNGNRRLLESELSDALSFTSPRDRLLGGFSDSGRAFQLRLGARRLISDYLQSAAAGFIGGRVELIPHQLSVAHETAMRRPPRVLLSDEVGLGKTIEACLVLHRLLLGGHVERVLILVPESLVHQWFIELVRRFNLLFRIVDAQFAEAFFEGDPDGNLFLLDQMAICSIDYLSRDADASRQAIKAGWDLVIIDEAHHLTEESRAYHLAESISRCSRGLLLLTATPEQLGRESHFARLRLLDPARYYDYRKFEQEAERYHRVAEIANLLLEKRPLDAESLGLLDQWLPEMDHRSIGLEKDWNTRIIQELLDRHGLGRVLFRNTRAAVSGFPPREVTIIPLDSDAALCRQAEREWQMDDDLDTPPLDYRQDPRLLWLVEYLRRHRREKVVLICRRSAQAFAIQSALQHHSRVPSCLFHEEMT
ncbi:DEAD/DEAH box helicase family protein, partial [candidate division KSB1 bacterium]|nr:DEAD/DEAH box helicase family protein [candidate division KSB1 bacterium]